MLLGVNWRRQGGRGGRVGFNVPLAVPSVSLHPRLCSYWICFHSTLYSFCSPACSRSPLYFDHPPGSPNFDTIFSESAHDTRRQRQWQAHTGGRAKFRERQAARLEEERRDADREYEGLRRRKDEIAARQLVRQDKLLKQEAQHADEVSRRRELEQKHERNVLLGNDL